VLPLSREGTDSLGVCPLGLFAIASPPAVSLLSPFLTLGSLLSCDGVWNFGIHCERDISCNCLTSCVDQSLPLLYAWWCNSRILTVSQFIFPTLSHVRSPPTQWSPDLPRCFLELVWHPSNIKRGFPLSQILGASGSSWSRLRAAGQSAYLCASISWVSSRIL